MKTNLFLPSLVALVSMLAATAASQDTGRSAPAADTASNPDTLNIQAVDSRLFAKDSIILNVDTAGLSATSPDSSRDTATHARIKRSPSAAAPDSDAQADASAPDTSFRVWHHPYWAIGAGWGIGAMPVFESWQAALPNTLADIDSAFIATKYNYIVSSEPVRYNVNFPISVAFTPVTKEHFELSLKALFSWMHKKYEASVEPKDSGKTVWESEKHLSTTSLALGVFLNRTIPPRYFFINNVEKASFQMGVAAAPLNMLRNRAKTTKTDSYDNFSFGTAVLWYAGLRTLRQLSAVNGLEVGLSYAGSWNGRFMRHGSPINRGSINPFDSKAPEELDFLAHRFVIYFNVLAGKKAYYQQKV